VRWLEDRIAESAALQARSKYITDSAMEVYEFLWREIMQVIEDARKHKFPLFTDVSFDDRVISLSVDPGPPATHRNRDELHVRLAADKHSITAVGPRVNIVLNLDICEDGIVCLKSKGEHIAVKDAAIKILDCFLFPDLPRKY
jgi:hypothetical protein